MSLLVAIVGKPSCGKSTILNALTNANAKMGDYPFTTINPNLGVGHVRVNCPCKSLDERCAPNAGKCIDGIRYIPVEILDVAGLVPGASEGKGMGNQFLDDLRRASGFIHVVDVSGTTDDQGNKTTGWDPAMDIIWLEKELTKWIYTIIFSNWDRGMRKLESDRSKIPEYFHQKLSGLGATLKSVKTIVSKIDGFTSRPPSQWQESEMEKFAFQVMKDLFPSVIAANKIDKEGAHKNFQKLSSAYPDYVIIPVSGLAELALSKYTNNGAISYDNNRISYLNISGNEISVVKSIEEKIIDVYGSTGVHKLLESIVFDVLNYIPVFPVEDVTHLTDKDGRVLPDVYLVKQGATAKDVAGQIHSDFSKHFLHGVLAPAGRRVSSSYVMQYGDVIKIVSSAK